LNTQSVDIRLIVTSDGATSPEKGCQNLGRLLSYFGKGDFPIGKGKKLGKSAPPWRTWSEELHLPEGKNTSNMTPVCASARQAILKAVENDDGPILYFCVGPLTNLAEALSTRPEIAEKISRLIYYGGHPDAPNPGWNTERDREAARLIYDSSIQILSFHPPEKKLLPFDIPLLEEIGERDTVAANLVRSLHSRNTVEDLLSEGHFLIWDELPAIYLSQPSLFRVARSTLDEEVLIVQDFDGKAVRKAYVQAFNGFSHTHLVARPTVTWKAFPVDPDFFQEDLQPYVSKIISRYGLEEWKACVLTNELHRHLGAYSLVGAKMGIRAREILNAPLDAVEVVSLAGNKTPLSCMNDGLQVATGASLGRGTIEVMGTSPKPTASFAYRGKKITLTVKKEFSDKIKADIKSALETYGGLTPEYFAHIRKLAIAQWLNLDRKDLFHEETVLPATINQ
jgi:pyrimidine-specific ribonucleoside hydrolase